MDDNSFVHPLHPLAYERHVPVLNVILRIDDLTILNDFLNTMEGLSVNACAHRYKKGQWITAPANRTDAFNYLKNISIGFFCFMVA
ncbi:MAG: hypothetical protein IJ879_02625 [Muribaculaceae bacterium]|nr:hypothetical protein [Muribaculaceae bacterium]